MREGYFLADKTSNCFPSYRRIGRVIKSRLRASNESLRDLVSFLFRRLRLLPITTDKIYSFILVKIWLGAL